MAYNDPVPPFRQLLADHIERTKQTQAAIAAELAVTPATVSRWASGTTPDDYRAPAIAALLNEPVERIVQSFAAQRMSRHPQGAQETADPWHTEVEFRLGLLETFNRLRDGDAWEAAEVQALQQRRERMGQRERQLPGGTPGSAGRKSGRREAGG